MGRTLLKKRSVYNLEASHVPLEGLAVTAEEDHIVTDVFWSLVMENINADVHWHTQNDLQSKDTAHHVNTQDGLTVIAGAAEDLHVLTWNTDSFLDLSW